jgi:hypothetical protein
MDLWDTTIFNSVILTDDLMLFRCRPESGKYKKKALRIKPKKINFKNLILLENIECFILTS